LMHAGSPQDIKRRKRNDDQGTFNLWFMSYDHWIESESGSPKRIRHTEDPFGCMENSTPVKPEITWTESCKSLGSRRNTYIMNGEEKQSMNGCTE
jgi:hypothetical protein